MYFRYHYVATDSRPSATRHGYFAKRVLPGDKVVSFGDLIACWANHRGIVIASRGDWALVMWTGDPMLADSGWLYSPENFPGDFPT